MCKWKLTAAAIAIGWSGMAAYELDLRERSRVEAGNPAEVGAGFALVADEEGRRGISSETAGFVPPVLTLPEPLSPAAGGIRFFYKPVRPFVEAPVPEIRRLVGGYDADGNWNGIGINVYASESVLPWFLVNDPALGLNHGPYRESALRLNTWHRFEAGWRNGEMVLAVDGVVVERKKAPAQMPWSRDWYLGGSRYGHETAGGLIAGLEFLDTPPEFSGQFPLTALREREEGHWLMQQLRDDAEGFFFYFESPESGGVLTIRPEQFPVAAGGRLWIETTDSGSYELIPEADGEILLPFAPTLFNQVMISRTSGNVAANPGMEEDSGWTAARLEGDVPTVFWRAEGFWPTALSEETGSVFAPDFRRDCARGGQRSLALTTEADGRTVTARSDYFPLKAGETYLGTAHYHAPESRLGNGLLFVVEISGDNEKPWLATGWNFRRATPVGNWMELTVPFAVGANTVNPRGRVILAATGKPFTVWWDDIDVRPEPVRQHKIQRPLTEEQTRPVWSEETMLEELARRPPPVPGIRRDNGVTRFTLNGGVEPYLGYYAFPNWRGCREFAADGVPLQWLFTYSGYGNNRFWIGRDQYDFTRFDEELKRAIRQAPEAVFMISLVCDPYHGFAGDFPDAAVIGPGGKRVLYGWLESDVDSEQDPFSISYAAADYRREAEKMIRALAEHLKLVPWGNAVAGIHIMGGNDTQWFPPQVDTGTGNRNAFREYLAQSYRSDPAAFRRAWGDDALTFENAPMPDRTAGTSRFLLDPARPADRRVIDLYRYRVWYPLETVFGLARSFREAIGRPVWVTTYYNDSMAGNDLAKERLGELLRSGLIDGVTSCLPYGLWRLAGEPGACNSMAGSIRLHGKLLFGEMDYRTDFSNYDRRGVSYDFQTVGAARGYEEHRSQMRRDLGMLLAQGQSGWFYSLAGLTWADAGFREQIREAAQAVRRVTERPQPQDRAPVAVFADPDSSLYSRRDNFAENLQHAALANLRRPLALSGLGFDTYMLEDLTHPERPEYKINLFARAAALTREEIVWIQRHLQKDGNVNIFFFDTGRAGGEGLAAAVAALTGIRVQMQPEQEILYRNLPGGVPSEWGRSLDFTFSEVIGPLIEVIDPEAETLARFKNAPDKVAAAMKRHDGWTGIYIAAPGGVTPEFLQLAAREAGVTPTADAGDAVYVGNGVIAIHAMRGGEKVLRWDGACDLIDPGTGEVVARNVESYTFELPFGESRWFQKVAAE